MTYRDELAAFMEALKWFESDRDCADPPCGNYMAIGPATNGGDRARGAYQIMGRNWAGWAAEAGISGADWRDPRAQDIVARHKLTRYYETYGSWDLVAIAWFAGPGRADHALRNGIASVAGISDVLGTTVAEYASQITRRLKEFIGDEPSRQTFGDPEAERVQTSRRTARRSRDIIGTLQQSPLLNLPGDFLAMTQDPLAGRLRDPSSPAPPTRPHTDFRQTLTAALAEMSRRVAAGSSSTSAVASEDFARQAAHANPPLARVLPNPEVEEEEA